MNRSSWFGAGGDSSLKVLWEDGEFVFCRGESHADGGRAAALAILPAAEHPTPATLDRLVHEYGLKDELKGAWAVRPLELVRERGRIMLLLEDTRSEPLHRLLGAPMEVLSFLRLAIAVAAVLTQVHRRGLVHKDIKPAHILVNRASGEVKLTGFGIASRLPRERQAPAPPESIAGTLAYMAPEQTGRMNRSIDARSDLYALGVTLYQMITGSLPFAAADPMEWVHCHIARKPAPPSERLTTVPAALSALILKLLAKTAEERYQTAAGLELDLRRCLVAWEPRHRIDAFALGQQDTPGQLLIPEKLYGREREAKCAVWRVSGGHWSIGSEWPRGQANLSMILKISICSAFFDERLCRTSAESRVRKIDLVNGFSYFRRRRRRVCSCGDQQVSEVARVHGPGLLVRGALLTVGPFE
jgi:serine/threonine protein kinase